MLKVEESIFLNGVAAKALEIPEDGFLIEDQPLNKTILLQEDTLIPVFVGLSNVLGELLFEEQKGFDCIYPLHLEKKEESLCFVKIVDNNNCKQTVPNSMKILLTMEVMDSIFVPNNDNKIDLTHLVRTWREVLSPIKEGQKINIKDFYESLVVKNLEILANEHKLRK